jgi:peptidyl-prolyl cis-trans isomerase A (cyclophilin A)
MNFLLLTATLVLGSAGLQKKPHVVVITTSKGVIEVQLDPVHAPETTKNFLRYVDAGHYNGGQFHRTVTMANQPDKKIKIEVIQASVNRAKEREAFPAIKLERTNKTGILHKDGTISMARDKPDTAVSDFFICIGPQPELDFGGKRNPDGQGFGAFGHVKKGMDVVRKIQQSHANKQALDPEVKILSVKRKG